MTCSAGRWAQIGPDTVPETTRPGRRAGLRADGQGGAPSGQDGSPAAQEGEEEKRGQGIGNVVVGEERWLDLTISSSFHCYDPPMNVCICSSISLELLSENAF